MRTSMRKWFCRVGLLCLAAWPSWGAEPPLLRQDDFSWVRHLRPEHPRIFLHRETLPAIRARALEKVPEHWQALLERVERYPLHPEIGWGEGKLRRGEDGKYQFVPPHAILSSNVLDIIGGVEAQDTAFAYLLSGDRKYLEKARNLLLFSVRVYEWALENQLMLEWEIRHYPGTCMAYDWLYHELTPAEREQVIRPLLENIRQLQPGGKATHHRCHGGARDGFYGVRALPWYIGLAAYGDGIDDAGAREMLQTGFNRYLEMLDYRDSFSGGDGVLASSCMGYAMGAYPASTFNFFFSFGSATGLRPELQFTQMRDFPHFVFWNMIPATPRPLEFGLGDAPHLNNYFPLGNIYATMQQIRHFYGPSAPDAARLATQLIQQLPEENRRYLSGMNRLLPFLLTGLESEEGEPDAGDFPSAHFRYFPTIGIAFMRSGSGPDDTYAAFRGGSRLSAQHQHYDENHFVIYRQGFLALDAGTRGKTWSYHLPWYYAQSVAHNTMLIHLPDEAIAPYWGPEYRLPWTAAKPLMHGGQYRQLQAAARSSDTPWFAYVSNDATGCYRPEKCSLARREFLFAYPDLFLVIDKVEAVQADFRKEWLLHSQEEPEMLSEQRFTVAHGGGRLLGQTLYPEVRISKVGGPGRQFWASGRNWELHPEFDRGFRDGLTGNWRLEVTPAVPARYDILVHQLQTAPRAGEAAWTAVQCREETDALSLQMSYQGRTWEIRIPRAGGGATRLRLRQEQQQLFDQDL